MGIAVIGDQGRTALTLYRMRDFFAQRDGRWRNLVNRAGFRCAARGWHGKTCRRCGRGGEGQHIVVECYHALMPAFVLPDILAKRQGIEKLIGQQQERLVEKSAAEMVFPAEREGGLRQGLLLCGFERRAGFHQHHFGVRGKFAVCLCGTQGVGHQGAAPRPQFDQAQGLRLAQLVPHRHAPGAEQFAEHLRDFRRGDEIARASDRITCGIDAVIRVMQRQRHELRDGNRPLGRNQPRNALAEQVHAGLRGWRHAYQRK